jgi:hypothetical protein
MVGKERWTETVQMEAESGRSQSRRESDIHLSRLGSDQQDHVRVPYGMASADWVANHDRTPNMVRPTYDIYVETCTYHEKDVGRKDGSRTRHGLLSCIISILEWKKGGDSHA